MGVEAGRGDGLGAAGVGPGAGGVLSCRSAVEGVAVGIDDGAGEGVEKASATSVGEGV